MADDTSMAGAPDRSRIPLCGVYEVRYWTDKHGIADGVKAAMHAVGGLSRCDRTRLDRMK
jgi:hypothetical protein